MIATQPRSCASRIYVDLRNRFVELGTVSADMTADITHPGPLPWSHGSPVPLVNQIVRFSAAVRLGVALGVTLLTITACGSTTVTKTVTVATGTPAASSTVASQPPTTQAAAPNPSGKSRGQCDYLLGNFTESSAGFRVVADVRVINTGNIGIVATAKAVFRQLGSAPIVVQRKGIYVPVHASKLVHLSEVISQNQIDALQSAGGGCSTGAVITNTFGNVSG